MKYFGKIVFVFLLLAISTSAFSQSITGVWKTISDKDQLEKSHIEIYEEDGLFFGKVIKLLDKSLEICKKCKGEKKDQHLVGLTILEHLSKSDDIWKDGRVLNPSSGKTYECFLELENENILKVRGFVGIPAIGRTQYWYRVNG
jgi:uncharacterized protein (DUF2147 family)